jgi:hypothetical protein
MLCPSGVEHKRTVVIRVVVRAQSGRAATGPPELRVMTEVDVCAGFFQRLQPVERGQHRLSVVHIDCAEGGACATFGRNSRRLPRARPPNVEPLPQRFSVDTIGGNDHSFGEGR